MVATPAAHLRMAGAQDGMGAGASDPDRFLNELEEALKSAVDLEQFEEAVKARQRLQDFMLERNDVNGVLHANRDFYEAFSTGNYERMGNIWFKDDHVQCVHAGHKALRGYDRIMAAFAAQFRTVRSLTVTADDVRVTVRGTLAWVLCTQQMRHAPTGTNRALVATNIFRCVGGRWQLVHHHAGYAKSASGLGGALGGVFGSLGEGEGGGMSGGIRIIDTSAMMGGSGSLEDVTGLIGRVIDGSSGGAHLLASAGDDGMLLADDEQAAEELCRVTLHYVCTLGRERALTSRQKRLLVTDVIEHDGCESPVRCVSYATARRSHPLDGRGQAPHLALSLPRASPTVRVAGVHRARVQAALPQQKWAADRLFWPRRIPRAVQARGAPPCRLAGAAEGDVEPRRERRRRRIRHSAGLSPEARSKGRDWLARVGASVDCSRRSHGERFATSVSSLRTAAVGHERFSDLARGFRTAYSETQQMSLASWRQRTSVRKSEVPALPITQMRNVAFIIMQAKCCPQPRT
jgi:ketosteroid isomerase-like protein